MGVRHRAWTVLIVVGSIIFGSLLGAQTVAKATDLFLTNDPPAATTEDGLLLQIVILKSQLSQALAASARCEAEGSQSAKVAQEASTIGQGLVKALDARGLMIDSTNKIVAKPKPEAKP